MNWRDLLYFSRGERRALTLLLCLITASWITLLLTDEKTEVASLESNRAAPAIASSSRKSPSAAPKSKPENKNNFLQTEKQSLPNERPKNIKNIPRFSYGKKNSSYKPYPRTEKYPEGTVVELNTADTATLKKVPGIGSTFAGRIIKYRELLGGYYAVLQLREVYGIDEERFQALEHWFTVDTVQIRKLSVNRLPADSLRRHPYLDYRQARIVEQLRKQKSRLSGWENLLLIEELTDTDRNRLRPYLSFE